MMKKKHNYYHLWIGLALGLFSMVSCKEETRFFGEPYGEGKPALGITIDRSQVPEPATGGPGTVVSIKATGLTQYRDQLIFRFNGEQAEIQEVTEEGLKVVVPTFASKGVTSISVGDIVVFGPEFDVEGKVRLDPTFRATQGANGGVYDLLVTNDDRIIVVGAFTDYNNKGTVRPINRIARTFADGDYDNGFRSSTGANGALYAITEIGNKYYIGGAFSGYGQRTSNISNLTALNNDGSIDSVGIQTWRRPDQEDTTQFFPRFNGGVHGGSIEKAYNQQNKLLVTGNFRYYVSRQYDKPNRLETRDTIIIDSTEMRQFARLNLDGTLDKTYRFDESTNKSPVGANAAMRTIYHNEGPQAGKLLVFGYFSTFDGEATGRILRLNADGTRDATFNPGGVGFDYNVENVTYNRTTRKYLVCGFFRTYNGNPVGSVVLLNEDGSLDNSFNAQSFTNGSPHYACQLSNGLIFVSGDFQQYGSVVRNGMMFLDAAGNLAEGYNNVGSFRGWIWEVYETQSTDNKPALLIIGAFTMFDGEEANNIVRIIME